MLNVILFLSFCFPWSSVASKEENYSMETRAALAVNATAENPSTHSLEMCHTLVPQQPKQRAVASCQKSVHNLKHKRVRRSFRTSSEPADDVGSDVASGQRECSSACNIDQYLHSTDSSVRSFQSMSSDVHLELEQWKVVLPSFAEVIDEISTIAQEVLRRSVASAEEKLRVRRDQTLEIEATRLSAPYREKMAEFDQRATAAARQMDELSIRRKKYQHDTRQFLEAARESIVTAKTRLDEFQSQERIGNDRIQALYARSREFRQIVAKREDVEKSVDDLLAANEALTKEKGLLVESMRSEFDSIEPAVNAIHEKKIDAERRIHQLNNKRLTVLRQVNAETRELERRDGLLRSLTHRNEELCDVREMWSARVSAMEAEALRDYTPRPDWYTSAGDHGTTVGVVMDSLAPQISPSIEGVDVPPLTDFVEVKKRATSTHVLDASLKKLGALMVNSKRAIDELLRLNVVLQPIIRCSNQCIQDDTARVDAELDGILVHEQHFSMIPVGLVLPPGATFAECVVRIQPQGPVLSVSDTSLLFRNEKWSQAATERQAIAMMTSLPQITLSANVLNSATSPLLVASELLAKWCASNPERDPATGFGANFLTSLRHYCETSSICYAAFGIIHGKLPVGFGDQVLQHIEGIIDLVEGGPSPSGVPMRAVMGSIGRAHAKDNLFGVLQLHQAKVAMGADAASTGAVVRLSSIHDIVDQRKNSGLFVRCLFHQFLEQHQKITCALSEAIVEVGKSSPVIKLLVISDAMLKHRIDTLKWDAETAMASPGVRYGQLGAAKRSLLGITNKGVIVDTLTAGLTRYDGSMLRLFEEDPHASQVGAVHSQSTAPSQSVSKQAKKIEYVSVDAVLQRLPSTLFRIGEK